MIQVLLQSYLGYILYVLTNLIYYLYILQEIYLNVLCQMEYYTFNFLISVFMFVCAMIFCDKHDKMRFFMFYDLYSI